jgi:hypothetical protein
MKSLRSMVGLPDADILREKRVQALQKPIRGDRSVELDMCDLGPCMDPCVRSSCPDKAYRVACHTFQTLLDPALDCGPFRLHLPPLVDGSVVGKGEAVERHVWESVSRKSHVPMVGDSRV